MITLARASTIPARYVSCFAPGVTPPDFHAVAEVYLGEAWHLIDATGMAEASSSNYVVDFLSSSEGLQLNRAFVKIGDAKVRRKIVDLVKALAAEADSE